MMHTKPMQESEGDFSEYKDADAKCPKCGADLKYRIWTSSCGGYDDYKIECQKCRYYRWIEGPDA